MTKNDAAGRGSGKGSSRASGLKLRNPDEVKVRSNAEVSLFRSTLTSEVSNLGEVTKFLEILRLFEPIHNKNYLPFVQFSKLSFHDKSYISSGRPFKNGDRIFRSKNIFALGAAAFYLVLRKT